MAVSANLLVTYEPAHSGSAEREVKALLGKEAKFLKSAVDGIFLIKTKTNSKKLVGKIRKECKDDPSLFKYTFNWVPIEKWYDSGSLEKVMKSVDKKLDAKKSWKLEINKRLFDASMSDLIMKLTGPINKPKVDLKNPEQIVRVEILKNKAGISVLTQDEVLNVPSMKR